MSGTVAAGESGAVARCLAPSLVAEDASERPITVDQTNYSVVVGEVVVVKWLRDPMPPPHRGAQLLSHLTGVGFVEMPRFLGVREVSDRIVAVVTAYVSGSRDGWDWYVDELTAALDAGDPAVAIATARRLGSLAGRLHAALATPSAVIAEPVRSGAVGGEHARGARLLAAAQRLLVDDAAERLAAVADGVAGDIATLAAAGTVLVQPVHGDLHVGQMLRRGDDIVVTDFDGDPVSTSLIGDDPVDGVERRTPMVDLAALVQSVDHVARVVARRRPDLAEACDEFVAVATSAVVAAYGEIAPVDVGLLGPLRAIQELHEFVYAATVLPGWQYVPEAAIAALYQ